MKNKKGFTLVELLAVVVILGLIALITIPAVNRFILNSKDRAFDFAKSSMETAATNFLSECEGYIYGENDDELGYCAGFPIPKGDGDTTTIPLAVLIEHGYLDPIEDPGDDNEFCKTDVSYVIVENVGGDSLNYKLKYTAKLFCPSNEYESGDNDNINTDFHVLVTSKVLKDSGEETYEYGSWTKDKIRVTLSTSFTEGTLDRFEYREFNSGDWERFPEVGYIIFDKSMNKKIQFRGVAIDENGNEVVSANKDEYKVYRIDITPPSGNIRLVGDKNVDEDGVLFKTSVVAKCGNVADNHSGLKSCGVSTTKGDYKKSVSFTAEALSYTIYMQAIDKMGNVYETEKTFGIDQHVPSLGSLLVVNPDGSEYTSGTWTKETIRIKGIASDNLKVNKIVYDPSDGDPTSLGPDEYYVLDSTRQTTLTITAKDGAEYESGKLTVDVKIDKNKPVIGSVTGLEGDYVTSRLVQINATDTGGSGLHAQAYSFDNGATWQSSNSKTFTSNTDINVKVRDSVGNISDVFSHEIKNVDSDGPAVSKVVGDPESWSKEATVTISASDDKSGLHATPYSFDNCSTWQASNSKKYTANAHLTLCVRDKLGNKTKYTYDLTKVDSAAPSIIKVDGNTTAYTVNKTLTINAVDNGSGLPATPYSWDNGSTWVSDNSKTFTGNETVNIKVRDALGNTASTSIKIEKVDKTAPTVTGVSGNPSSWAKSATLVISASDAGAGLHATPYSWDNGSTWVTDKSKTYTSNTTVNIKVRDVAGNISNTTTVNITKVDSQAESLNVTGNPGNWTTSATLSISVTENGPSKLHSSPYSWDNGSTWTTSASKKFTSNQTVNVKVRDKAGNVSTKSVVINRVDSSKPSCSTSKSGCGSGGCTVKVSCSDSGGSGVSTCAGVSGSSRSIGGVTSGNTYTVKDGAGNSNTCSVSVSSSTSSGCSYYACSERYNYTFEYDYGYNCRGISGSACCTGLNCGIHFSNGNCACNGGEFTCPGDWPTASCRGYWSSTTYY